MDGLATMFTSDLYQFYSVSTDEVLKKRATRFEVTS